MKKILFIISILLFSCNTKTGLQNENGVVFESDKLKGKYKLDISEIVSKNINSKSTEIDKMTSGLALASANININFYGNGKAIFEMDFGALGAFVGEKNKLEEINYKLENDSVLIIQDKRLIIRKFSDSFDYIKLIDKEENKNYLFKKVAE